MWPTGPFPEKAGGLAFGFTNANSRAYANDLVSFSSSSAFPQVSFRMHSVEAGPV